MSSSKRITTRSTRPLDEGFLFGGKDAERTYHQTGKFEFINTGGYYHSLPLIRCASSLTPPPRCSAPWASKTKKDHPEVAPASLKSIQLLRSGGRGRSNPALQAALPPDRQQHGLYGQLPAQAGGSVNGSGMHTNVSVSKGKTNLFWTRRARSNFPLLAGVFSTAS